jgi:N-succinyl-L-ornithine transcarbamylase
LDKDKDNAETVMAGFLKYATVPVVNMEGAPVTHYNPLPMRLPWKSSKQNTDQGRFILGTTPKSFASGCRQFFVEMMQLQEADFVITHPYELNRKLLKTPRLLIRIKHLKMLILSILKTGAVTKITVKSLITTKWTVTADKMKLTNHAKFMHCLPDVMYCSDEGN